MWPHVAHHPQVQATERLCRGSRSAPSEKAQEMAQSGPVRYTSFYKGADGPGQVWDPSLLPQCPPPSTLHSFSLTTRSFCFSTPGRLRELLHSWCVSVNLDFLSWVKALELLRFLLYYIMFLPFKRLAGIISVRLHEWHASFSLISLWCVLRHRQRVSVAYTGSLQMKGHTDLASHSSAGLKHKMRRVASLV